MKNKLTNIIIWIVQGILAAMFLMAGTMKTTTPIAQLATKLPWAAAIPEWLVRFIGASEFLGALGLVLPSLFKIKPKLTVYAATGILTIMVFAMIFHFSRNEMPAIGFNLVIALFASIVIWGRTKGAPIQAK